MSGKIPSHSDIVHMTNAMAPSEDCATVRLCDQALRELVAELADAMRDHLDVGPSSTLYYVKQLLARAKAVKP